MAVGIFGALVLAVLIGVAYPTLREVARRVDITKDRMLAPGGVPYLRTTVTTFDPSNPNVAPHRVETNTNTTNSASCNVLTAYADGSAIAAAGFEDVVYVTDSLLLACAGNLARLWAPNAAPIADIPSGECVTIRALATGGRVRIDPAPLVGFPAGVKFFPHGVYVQQPKHRMLAGTRVFALNHAYTMGGERIEVFDVTCSAADAGQHGDASPGCTLRHIAGLSSEYLTHNYAGILNDLVVTSDTDLYVTVYLGYPDNVKGRGVKETWIEWLRTELMLTETLADAVNTTVLHCTFALNPKPRLDCGVAADLLRLPNGVALLPDDVVTPSAGPNLLVLEMGDHSLRWMLPCVDHATNAPNPSRLCTHWSHTLTHTGDNLQHEATERDGTTVRVHYLVGSIHSFIDAIAADKDHTATFRGGATRVTMSFDTETKALRAVTEADLAFHDGTTFQGIASAAVVRPRGGRGDAVVMGSFREPGIMVCDV